MKMAQEKVETYWTLIRNANHYTRMSGDKHESDLFSNQHAPIMRIQIRLYFMKCDKSSETMISSLVFAAIHFSSTVAATMLLIFFDMQKYVVPYYTNTHMHIHKHTYIHTHTYIHKHTHTHTHTAVNSLMSLVCYLFLVPKMSLKV
jgi:hypothetical protein